MKPPRPRRGCCANHLEAFFAVYETGSCSKAGEWLDLRQPTVSLKIKSLERQIGSDLFERPSLRPLPKAHEMYQRYRQVFALLRELRGAAASVAGPHFTIGASEYIMREYLLDIVGLLRRQCPALAIVMKTGAREELERWLRRKEIDLAIMAIEATAPDLNSRILLPVQPVLLVPKAHRLRRASQLWTHRVIPEPLISPPLPEGVCRRLDGFLREFRRQWVPTMVVSSTAFVPPAVAAFGLIGLCLAVPTFTEEPGVRAVPFAELPALNVCAVWSGDVSETLSTVLEFTASQAQEITTAKARRNGRHPPRAA